ncbi:Phage stabilisation protein [Pragia fontium]|uniref:packaged DNA stabilization protein n=1 Tax=Pragia fontium TaxID=82985 RepID=UPI000DFFF2BD|nr:packaged DNA stabilization protein [Pragia fontium]SUB82026.1 Phage stabilisation protein [Pragia fontium]
MPVIQLPISKGLGKDFRNADYVDLLPVNMLATPKEVLDSAGYMRSFPGIERQYDVGGKSRAANFNTVKNEVYRVFGNNLYRSKDRIGFVAGTERVSMAYSGASQAVAAAGEMAIYRYDGEVKSLTNWPEPDAQYDIGTVIDICRARGRYAWVKYGSDTFGVTDLEDESHPDRYRPFYRAESQPDGVVGIDTWRDFIVCFGTSTIEYFSLSGATETSQPIYVHQPSLMVNKGIAGTHSKVAFNDSFVFISHQATGAPSIYMINSGQAVNIATATIEKILRTYSGDDLSQSVMEAVRFDSHELVIVHLLRHVLCYDASASQGGPQWTVLKSGLGDDIYRCIDFMYENNKIIVGDKWAGVTGALMFDSSSQYGEQTEHVLYTPLFKANNVRAFDFELEAATGVSQFAERLFISATVDGSNYGREQMIGANAPFAYDKRVLWRRLGRIRKNVGFKIRIVTRSPVTLSGCSARTE